MALVEGLKICKSLGIEKLEIEGDLKIIINSIRRGSMSNWILNSILVGALILCQSFRKMTINHIFREGNTRADELANKGVDGFTIL